MPSIKYYLLMVFFIISFLPAQHQHGGTGRPTGCEIYGTVVDSITGQAIEYASISVIGKDESIATGGITNFEGKFEIEEIKPGTYDIKIEFMGFSPVIFADIQLSFRGAGGAGRFHRRDQHDHGAAGHWSWPLRQVGQACRS